MSSFEYQLTRSQRRKTLSVVIRDGKVKVSVPTYVSDQQIKSFILKRHQWIIDHLSVQRQSLQRRQQFAKKFVQQEVFLWFGDHIFLHLLETDASWVELHGDQLMVSVSSRVTQARKKDTIKRLIMDWYKKQLHSYVIDRINQLEVQIGVKVKQIKVRQYKRRWGSCSADGVVSFNLLLAMVPPEVIEYVIIHELCHLVHMNHSRDFWQLVSIYYPDYLSAKQWLKDHSERLQLD